MSPTYYKAVRPDGTDFKTGEIDYLSAAGTDRVIKHPSPLRNSQDASDYLSISVAPGDCTGFRWDATKGAKLLEVTPYGKPWAPHTNMPNKRAVTGVRVVRELPSYMLFGPQGEAIVEMLNAFPKLSIEQRRRMYSLRDQPWYDACAVVNDGRADRAGLRAARRALYGLLDVFVVVRTAYGAALAVLLRHTIGEDGFTQAHYDTLTKPWVTVTGQKAHPEDVMF